MHKYKKSEVWLSIPSRGAVFLYFCMMELAELFDLLERRRIELELSQADVGRAAFGKANDTSLQNIRRGASPSFERVLALSKALGLEFYLGPPRTFPVASAKPIFYGMGDGQAAVFEKAPPEERDRHFLPIPFSDKPLHHGRKGAGPIAFCMSWFDELGLAPDHLRFVKIDGQGIAPLITPRSLVMINEADTAPAANAIFAYSRQGVLDVGELLEVKDGKGFILSRRAPGEAPEFFTTAQLKSEIRVLGRVVWFEGYLGNNQKVGEQDE